MPTLRWQPPAFLLPSWSEPQLTLLRQQIAPSLRPKPSTAPYHSQSRHKRSKPREPPTGPEEIIQFHEKRDDPGAAAIFGLRNPFPRRDDQGRRIMLPEDEQNIPKEQRVRQPTPLLSRIRRVESGGESEEISQRKVFELLRARKTLALQRQKERRQRQGQNREPMTRIADSNLGPSEELSPWSTAGSRTRTEGSQQYLDGSGFVSLTRLSRGKSLAGLSRLTVSSIEAAEARKKRLREQKKLLDSHPPTARELLFKESDPVKQAPRSDEKEVRRVAAQRSTHYLMSLDPLQNLVHGPDGLKSSKLSPELKDSLSKHLEETKHLSDSAQQSELRDFLSKSLAEREAAAKHDAQNDSPDLSWLAADFGPIAVEGIVGRQDAESVQEYKTEYYEKYKDVAAVIFNTYDRTLEKEDFMRIVPRGKHMQDWRGFGAPQKIWQVLNKSKLEGRRVFIMLFRTSADADEYIKRVKHLHYVLGMGPPAGSSEFEDIALDLPEHGKFMSIETLRNEFSLVTKGQSLDLKKFTFPFPKTIWNIIRGREFGDMNNQIAERRTVLFWLDGYRPDLLDIRDVLTRDGEELGFTWSTLDRIVRWQAGASPPKLSKAHQPGMSEDDEAEEEELETEEYGHIYEEAYLRNVLSRWLLTFDNETEARRFIRLWHMREWPQHWSSRRFKEEGESADGARVIANAKMLW